ncbi:ABC transporter permease [Candidatus Poribacteria bacterium]|nr:ABC transporter permease [Candidatus Poribacteria bacterium]
MKNRIFPVSRKEFVEIRRDPRTLVMVLVLPVMMLVLYSYAVNFDLKSIETVVYDLDNSKNSRELIGKFKNSGYFNIGYIKRYDDIDKQLGNGKAKLALCIPADFSRKLAKDKIATLQAIVDGSNANNATIAIGYINQIVQRYSIKISTSTLWAHGFQIEGSFPPIEMIPRVWYNPELKSLNFIVPGLIATIMMMLGAISTSLSIVSERERGTFEKLIVTPVRPYELVIGKIFPYVILAFIDVIFCLLVGKFWFKVPIKGSIPLLLCLSTLFLFSALGMGLFISAIAKTQRVAMLLSMLISLLPTFLLSGFVFPIENMPRALQLVTYLVPARYFLEILRGIFLKGVGLRVLWMDVIWLLIFSMVMVFISAVKFQKKLET